MKRILPVVLVFCLLVGGCKGSDDGLSKALQLRSQLLDSNGCSFRSIVTADYGDKTYTFSMQCQADRVGKLSFSVIEPDSISGITGFISGDGGKLTFDDKALTFPLIADGEVSPVSAPWLLVKTLLGGYISSCSYDGEYYLISIDDSYEEDALQLDIWLNNENVPVASDILWQGRRVLSIQIEEFTIV